MKLEHKQTKQTPWPELTRALCRPSDRRLSEKLEPIYTDKGSRVVRATDHHGCILDFLDMSCYHSLQVAPQLYSRG
jgi:hypothetical protein